MPLADAFVSHDAAVMLLTCETVPCRDLGGVDVKSIDVVKLSQLYSILTGTPVVELFREFPLVWSGSDDGPWICRFPAALQLALARMSLSEIAETASRWAQIKEFALDKVPATTVLEMLSDLARLARAAEPSDAHVYLWNCL
jgi:hypothetical protein